MTRPALTILEKVYQLGINPNGSYFDQLQQIAPSGHLANKTLLNEVVLGLCQVIDKQAVIIDGLQKDRVEIAKRMVILEKQATPDPTILPPAQLDPTKPL